ncbi:ATP-binding protein [Staphylococcus ureilyticus]
MEKTVKIPQNVESKDLMKLTSEFVDIDANPISNEFKLDFSELKYVSASAVALLDNLIGYLENKDVKISVSGIEFKEKMCPISFLRDAGFFEKYLDEPNEIFRIKKTKFIYPIESLNSTNYEEWTERFSYWISSIIGVDKNQIATLTVAVKEILNNVNDHANITTCGIFAQFIEEEKKFHISISDIGVGIPYNVKKFLNDDISDYETLMWAVEEGNSTKSTPRNRGVGLNYLINNIVENIHGKVEIYSNKANIICKNKGNGIYFYGSDNNIMHPGTLILIKLNKEEILNNLDEEEEFSWEEL